MVRLRMRDFWTFKPKEILENKRYLFECKDSASPTGSSLLVKVAATHSGVVNQNHRFYRPDRMQDAAHQWVPEEGKGYAKPVLFEHDKIGDVLGRVRTARYIDESYKWAADFPTIKDSVFYKVGDKKVDLFKSVDWIVDKLMGVPDYSGLGYIELGLNVTNPDAIAKVLRDEYLTVSVGFQTDSAICSVCHTDWAKDDKCDHHPGEVDEDSKRSMFLICGDFKYEEISFVNFPADPFAGKVAKDAIKDSLNRKFFMGLSHDRQQAFVQAAGMSMSDAKMDYDIQLVEEQVATAYDLNKSESRSAFEAELKDEKLIAVRALELKQTLLDWKPTEEADKTSKRSLMSTLNAKIKKNNWTGVDASAAAAAAPAADAVEDELAAAVADPAPAPCDACEDETDWSKFEMTDEDKAYFADEEGLYTELCLEMDAAVVAGELTAEDIKDAKLSTEKRKKLATGTFCGPGRSFPVPDCAHVVAARRLIGRYKGTGSKSAILSCVARKASSMGCGGKKADAVTQTPANSDTIQNSSDVQDSITALNLVMTDGPAKQAVDHYNGLDKIYKSSDDSCKGSIRMLHYDMGQKWSADSALAWSKKYLLEKEKDSVLVSAKDLADKEEAINTLTDEVAAKTSEVDAAKAQSQAMLVGIKKALATQIAIYKSMSGHADYKDLTKEALAAKVDELSKRHVTSLKDAVADIMSELKWKESTPAKPVETATEPGKPVADNAQVDPAVAITDSTASSAPVIETPADKLKKQQAENSALRDRLASMTPRDRTLYLADLAYNDAKAVIKN